MAAAAAGTPSAEGTGGPPTGKWQSQGPRRGRVSLGKAWLCNCITSDSCSQPRFFLFLCTPVCQSLNSDNSISSCKMRCHCTSQPTARERHSTVLGPMWLRGVVLNTGWKNSLTESMMLLPEEHWSGQVLPTGACHASRRRALAGFPEPMQLGGSEPAVNALRNIWGAQPGCWGSHRV